MDFQAWYFLDLEALESLIIARQLTDETLQEPDYVEFYYTCTLTTGITKDTVPLQQRPENCTTDRECIYTSRVWASESGTKRRKAVKRAHVIHYVRAPISFNLSLTTYLPTKLTGETILL